MIEISEGLKNRLKNNPDMKKNFRVYFPNKEADDIDNDSIVSESMTFTESICSQDSLKFGLCEGSVIEFDAVGLPNVKGAKIECELEVDIPEYEQTVKKEVYEQIENNIIWFDFLPDNLMYGGYSRVVIKTNFDVDFLNVQIDPDDEVYGTYFVENPRYIVYDRSYFESNIISRYGVHFTGTIDYEKVAELYLLKENEEEPTFIKLGTFIVDSCKKDANNIEKRHISAYSHTAYDDWQFPDTLKFGMKYYSWYKANTISFSFDTLKKIMFPRFNMDEENRHLLSENGYTYNLEMQSNSDISVKVYWKKLYTTDVTNTNFILYTARILNKIPDSEILKIRYLFESKIREYISDETEFNDFMSYVYSNVNFIPCSRLYYYNGFIKNSSQGTAISSGVYSIDLKSEFENYIEIRLNETVSSNNYTFYNDYAAITNLTKIEILNKNTSEIYQTYDLSGYGQDVEYYQGIINIYDSESALSIVPKKVKRTVYTNYVAKTGKTTRYDYIYELPESLKEIFEGQLELNGDFGRINREGEYEELSLGAEYLYPNIDVYPNADVYPGGSDPDIGYELYTKKNYSRLWTDDYMTKPYGLITCNYTNTYGETDVANYYINGTDETYDSSKYQSYDLSENYVIQNNKYTEEQIAEILENFGNKVKGIQYTPVQFSAFGLPYVEAGDRIDILTQNGSFGTYVLRRTLTGIQALKDSIEAN